MPPDHPCRSNTCDVCPWVPTQESALLPLFRNRFLQRLMLLQPLREIPLVRPQRIAYVPFEFELVHFLTRIGGRPMINRHAVSGDHHPRAVVAVTAVHENLLLRVVPKQLKKLRHRLVSRKPPGPSDGNAF